MPSLTERINERIGNEWMNLGDTSLLKTGDPFADKTPEDVEQPYLHIIKLLRNPNYFSFTCQYLFNKKLLPFQLAILRELWVRPFPMLIGSRGLGKSFLLALYTVLRTTLHQGCKVVVVGAAFRQSKVVFEYAEEIWNSSPVLRDICGGGGKQSMYGPKRDVDRCHFRIGESSSIYLPLGDGGKIRGQRANYIIAEEFPILPPDVYENVVAGFAAVSSSPVEKVKMAARQRAIEKMGGVQPEETFQGLMSNQSIIAGTAFYGFNHYCQYWKRWKAIIESRGDTKKLEDIFQGDVPAKFNWRDYSVIRMPVDLLPDGFMDEKHIAKAKATLHSSIYWMEFGSIFILDSQGFFKRSLIESCVVGNPAKPLTLHNHGEVYFTATLTGHPQRRYVLAADPASEHDNFALVLLECWDDHRRVVYCWTTTRKRYKEKLKQGIVTQQDFYGYCARKIRDLMKVFNIERIAIDTQGGGVAIIEALHDPDKILPGEQPLWPVIKEDEEQDTDDNDGLHLLSLISFAKAEWVSAANHGMKKDLEDKALLFPRLDSAVLGLALEDDKLAGRIVIDADGMERVGETLEDAALEVEEIKTELVSIVHTQTGHQQRDRWDTPEIKQAGGKKGFQRKDRYSALLMANMEARTLQRTIVRAAAEVIGGFAHELAANKNSPEGPLWQAPPWFNDGVGGVVVKPK